MRGKYSINVYNISQIFRVYISIHMQTKYSRTHRRKTQPKNMTRPIK